MNKNVGRTKSYRMREGERGANSYERVPSKNNVTLVALGILSEFTNEPILPILKFSTFCKQNLIYTMISFRKQYFFLFHLLIHCYLTKEALTNFLAFLLSLTTHLVHK